VRRVALVAWRERGAQDPETAKMIWSQKVFDAM
jgi:hypothetical protein